MTQENIELLIKDLCARLPYGVKVEYKNEIFDVEHVSPMYEEVKLDTYETWTVGVSDIKPYLFPLSSMTEEQREELYKIGWYLDEDKIYSCFRNYDDENYKTHTDCFELINWCYKNNFDINGFIPLGLAIDATGLDVY